MLDLLAIVSFGVYVKRFYASLRIDWAGIRETGISAKVLGNKQGEQRDDYVNDERPRAVSLLQEA